MKRFGVLGVFSEDGMERSHHTMKVYNRVFAHIREFRRREEAKNVRVEITQSPACQIQINEVKAVSSRKFSNKSNEIKKEKTKDDKKRSIVDKASDYIDNKQIKIN